MTIPALPPFSSKSEHGTEMPFLEHLKELRMRLVYSVIGLVVAACGAYAFAAEIFIFLTGPLQSNLANFFGSAQSVPYELIGTGPTEAFMVKLKVAGFTGIFISSPWSFYQLWKFVSPGLHDNERQLALPFTFLGTLSFLLGGAFCFYLVFPFAFQFFFEEFSSIGVHPSIKIGEYLEFIVTMTLVFGVIFELPLLSYFLARLGLINAGWLKKNFRYAVLTIFVVAGILTPPDMISQLLLATPLLVIYGICIPITAYGGRVAKAKTSKNSESAGV